MNLKNLGVTEISLNEAKQTEGGFFFLVALGSQALVLGSIAAAGAYIYAQAEAGYNQACN